MRRALPYHTTALRRFRVSSGSVSVSSSQLTAVQRQWHIRVNMASTSPPMRTTRSNSINSALQALQQHIDTQHPDDSPATTTPTKRRRHVKVEADADDEAVPHGLQAHATSSSSKKSSSSSKKQPTSSGKKLTKKQLLEIKVANTKPPANWRKTLDLIKQMRKEDGPAPVEHMGCESLADRGEDPKTFRFQTMVSLMLSSQTPDPVTAAATRNLQQNCPGGFNVQSILAIDEKDLDILIKKVGFHQTKAKHIKLTAEICQREYGGDIPRTIESLVQLPGIGPKMGYLTMLCAWDDCVGIGVDVHVDRISNRLGWVESETADETRSLLEAWLPREEWPHINKTIVGFGQTRCFSRNPQCVTCKVLKYCPTGQQITASGGGHARSSTPPKRVKSEASSSSKASTSSSDIENEVPTA